MSDLMWLNGEVVPMAEARIGVEDRGFQFADGVYEVVRLYGGKPFMLAEHLERLDRSCAGISLASPMSRGSLSRHIEQFLQRQPLAEGMIYLQVTRGCSPRNHVYPECRPTVLFYTRALPPMTPAGEAAGAALISAPDERWRRCWIKSIALLPNVLAKNAAIAAGADEAVFVENGWVSECSASNLFIVNRGMVLTHPVGPKVLPGITRLALLQLAHELGIPAVERPISEAEAMAADEVFITSTTREISWVNQWNGRAVGGATPGAVTMNLHLALQARVKRETA